MCMHYMYWGTPWVPATKIYALLNGRVHVTMAYAYECEFEVQQYMKTQCIKAQASSPKVRIHRVAGVNELRWQG